jgi:L-ascorbate metabolism protein UlaG (beta-lactamase superfamily)
MKIHQLRNATMILEFSDNLVLVDPMLGHPGSIPPFTVFRYKPQMNPLVGLPAVAESLLKRVDTCLITHSRALNFRPLQHLDHLDPAGERLLNERNLPVGCPGKDARYLRRYGLNVTWELPFWETTSFLGGEITAIPAVHGYGWVHHLMANGAGFLIRLPGEPSIYISGDTVLTQDVERVLTEERPDVAIVAAGQAQLDIGRPLLMTLEDVVRFVELAPGLVVANHLEALNHCPVTRGHLREVLEQSGLADKVMIPADGESLNLT